jgi:hypothetical protein
VVTVVPEKHVTTAHDEGEDEGSSDDGERLAAHDPTPGPNRPQGFYNFAASLDAADPGRFRKRRAPPAWVDAFGARRKRKEKKGTKE